MKFRTLMVAALMSLAIIACSGEAKQEWNGDPQLVYKLKMRMAEAEVREILGEPSEIDEMNLLGVKTVTWKYLGKENVVVILQDGKLLGALLGAKEILRAGPGDV